MRGSSHHGGARHAPWLVIVAGVCAALHVGKLSPALPALHHSLDISLLQAGLLLSLVQLAGMVLGLVLGAAADGVGLKRSITGGLVLLSAAAGVGGWSQSAAELMLMRAVEGVGFLLVVLPAPALIRRLVPPAATRSMLGYWSAYMPFGTALALLSGPWVLDALGWRAWWWCVAALSLALSLCIGAWVPAEGALRIPAARRPASNGIFYASRSWALRLRQTLASRGPWLVALSFAVYSGQWLAVIGFLPSVALQSEASGAVVGALLALAALVNMAGNILSGRLLQRGVSAHVLLNVGFCTMALGALLAFAMLPGAPGPGWELPLRYAGVVAFSMVGGLIPGTLFSLAVVLAPDEASVSTTVGWMQQWSAAGQFAGPPLVGWVASLAGGWHWTWVITGTCSLLGLLLARQIGRLVPR